jgi:phosphatidylserine/phosphatidylglycerophosphate/cardiolipin synthase-like enzyme
VDITGFGVPSVVGSPAEPFPDGAFVEAIGAGLKIAAGAAAKARRRLTVRVLVGVLRLDVTATPWQFRDFLTEMIGNDVAAVDLNVASMTTRWFTSYNHTKLVVVDGKSVIHGGINWMTNFYIEDGPYGSRGFGGSAPVTDLDIALRGPAAASAGKFLDELWTWTCQNAAVTTLRPGGGVWLATNNDRVAECKPKLYAAVQPYSPGNLQAISVGSLGYGIQKNDPLSKYQPPPADNVDEAACVFDWFGRRRSNNETNTDRDFMTVNPDANALRALIACAQQKIVLSQQDINGFSRLPLYHALFDVRLLDVLAAKMTADAPVKVRIVLSNPGSPDFSNVSDLNDAVQVLFRRIRLKTPSEAHAYRVLEKNLQLAPLRVSDQPAWPNGYKYRLHTKVVCVDDTAFYIGSRNVYPDTTQDYGFIIEDAAAARQLNTQFLDKVWQYSQHAAIYDWERNIHPPYPVKRAKL